MMENNSGMEKNRKNIRVAGILAVIGLAVAIMVAVLAVGRKGQSDDKASGGTQEGNGGQDTGEPGGTDRAEEEPPVTAMYVPFGEDSHIFVGEQAGVFVATFPDEMYDINGNKISKEQLVKGNMVEIYGNGMMLESYPGQYPGITKMKVVEEGKPSDADAYQEIVDEIYQEPDTSEPPMLNVEYTTELVNAIVVVNRGGYEWVYMDQDGLSNAVVADSRPVLDWKIGEELADIKIGEPLELILHFSAEPEEVEALRYDASFLGRAQEEPEGEKVPVGKKDGNWTLDGVMGGYVYEVTGIWENGRANYGFVTLVQE